MKKKVKILLIALVALFGLIFISGGIFVIYQVSKGEEINPVKFIDKQEDENNNDKENGSVVNNEENNDSDKEKSGEVETRKVSELAHCGLIRENFQSMTPDKVETSAVLTKSEQKYHLEDVVWKIEEFNIYGEEITADPKFKAKVELIEKEIEAGISTGEYYLLLKELIAVIGDNHSAFLTPEEGKAYDESFLAPKSKVSAGVSLVSCIDPWSKKGAAMITYVYEGGPADRAGIKPFQIITEINSEPTVKDGKLNLKSGDESVRKYKVRDFNGDIKQYDMVLEDVVKTQVIYKEESEYHYFNIKSFNISNINKFADLYYQNADQDKKPIVIDLRFNTGGDVTALHKLLGYFFPTGTKIGQTKSTTSSKDEIIGSSTNIKDREIYIWTWYLTDSASQIFTGVMSEYDEATTIGVDLDGNVETISCTSTYPDNARVCNSKEVFIPSSGNNWHKDGIPVDYEIGELIWGKFHYGNDPYKSKTESLIN